MNFKFVLIRIHKTQFKFS